VEAPQFAQKRWRRCQLSRPTRGEQPGVGGGGHRGHLAQPAQLAARAQRGGIGGARVDPEHRALAVHAEQHRLAATGELRQRDEHRCGAVDEHALVRGHDSARRRVGEPPRDPRIVGPALAHPVQRRTGEGVCLRPQEMATMRSIGTRARSAMSAGTFTSPVRSRRQSRSLGSVIIFM
jgi:hypothetical protein